MGRPGGPLTDSGVSFPRRRRGFRPRATLGRRWRGGPSLRVDKRVYNGKGPVLWTWDLPLIGRVGSVPARGPVCRSPTDAPVSQSPGLEVDARLVARVPRERTDTTDSDPDDVEGLRARSFSVGSERWIGESLEMHVYIL